MLCLLQNIYQGICNDDGYEICVMRESNMQTIPDEANNGESCIGRIP